MGRAVGGVHLKGLLLGMKGPMSSVCLESQLARLSTPTIWTNLASLVTLATSLHLSLPKLTMSHNWDQGKCPTREIPSSPQAFAHKALVQLLLM